MYDYFDSVWYYIISMDFHRFVRFFWFFIIFEVTRFYIIDMWVLVWWKIKSRLKHSDFIEAKKSLWKEQPLISIIIPGKNEGEHIYKLTISLREQTYQNFEIIVIDDGSDDLTPVIGANLKNLGYISMFIRNDVRGGKA